MRPPKPAPVRHLHESQEAWQRPDSFPEALRRICRYRELIGPTRAVACRDAAFGTLELEPGTYPAHVHPAPELYYVVEGRALWTVDGETFEATPGTAIYHPPGARHRMVNRGPEVLRTVWMWWAPGGRTTVLRQDVRLIEPMPR